MNNLKIYAACGLALFLLGLGVGRYYIPNKVTEIEKEKKQTETEREVIDREKKNADGSTEKEHIVRDVKKETKEKESLTIVENKKPDWKASALIGYSYDKKQSVYGLDVQRRILGTASIGIWATTDKTIGLSVGYEF